MSTLESPCPGSLVPRARVSSGGSGGGGGAAGACGRCWRGHSPPLPCAGIQRFCRDVHMMLGFKPGLYFRACWLFLSPATLLVTGGKEGWDPGLRIASPSEHAGRQGCPGPEWASVRAEGGAGTRIWAYSPAPRCPQLL